MDDKYYIPDKEEFRIGFEYEIFYEGQWKKTYVHYQTVGSDLIITIKGKAFWQESSISRVKYLDEEDLKELRWIPLSNPDSEYRRYSFDYTEYISFFHPINFEKEIILEKVGKWNYNIFSIEKEGGLRNNIFIGIVKNKGELRVIMKQIQIP